MIIIVVGDNFTRRNTIMNTQKKYFSLLVGVLCALLLLAACGKTEETKETKDTNKEETKEEVTLTDAMGKVTIPADVKNIIAPYSEDSLVALGVKPAAQWSIGTTVLDYLQTDLKGVPTIGWDLPLEQAIEASPDLIIFSGASAIQNGQYEEYKKVAPVYVYKDEDNADWRKQLQIMGQIVGKEKEAEDKLEAYETKAKQASVDIKKAIGDESAAIIWVIGEQYFLLENGRFAANVLYDDLGVAQPKMVQGLPKATPSWQPITLESLAKLDANHLFLASKPEEAGLAKLKESSIYKGLPSVTAGNVYEMKDPSHWTIKGLIANELTIDQIHKSLTK
jgi:iron complex transport system substrate-binding protein